MIQNLNSPLITQWNTDSQGNKISVMIENETHQVANCQITLNQIPDKAHKVQIDNMYEVNINKELEINEFKCDYNTGIISYNSAKEGQFIIIKKYYGRGVIFSSAKRIYDDSTGQPIPTIDKTLQDYIDSIKPFGYKGEYDDTEIYNPNSSVYYPTEKGIFKCIKTSQGILPTNTEYWELILSVKDVSDYAQSKGDYAKNQGDYAKTEGDYAKNQGDYAKQQGDYANDATQLANETVDIINNETLIIYKPFISTYANISITYPTPQLGWVTTAQDTGVRYRWNGTSWVNIGVDPNNTVGDLTTLQTIAKDKIVNAINENVNKMGNLSTLNTTNKASLVNATNELVLQLNDMSTKQGDITQLNTTDKSSLVNAIKEVKTQANAKADQTALNATNSNVSNIQSQVNSLASGSPKAVSLVSQMTDITKNYVYTGSESGYTAGNWYYWNGSAWISGGVYQATGSSELVATNLCTNGDFNNGTTGGWSALNSTHSVANKVLTNTANGTDKLGNETVYLSNLIIGHKYYLRGLVKVTNSVCDYISINMIKSSNGTQIVVNTPVNGTVYDVSFIFTATDIASGFSFIHKYVDAITANGKSMELQYVDIIDLSQTFGIGNEITKSQADQVISYYPNGYISGTVAPFVDNKVLMNILNSGFQPKNNNLNALSSLNNNSGLNGIVVQTGDGSFVDRRLIGTANQINVTDGNGINNHPTLSIPKNPMLMQPVTAVTTFGSELAPAIGSWIGLGGTTYDGSKWTIPAKGQLKAPISVESGAEYQIDITWTNTNDYGVLVPPKLIVSLGTVTSVGQFVGYSDALYKLTLTANITGTVDLILGDGIEDWYASITNISVKKVTGKVTPAGKLGVGSFDVTTMGSSFAIGNGLQKRTTGDFNVGLGLGALRDITTASYNIAMGVSALEQNDTGLNNIGLGAYALRYLRSGYYNIGIGYSAMVNNISGSWNIGIGNEVMRDLITGTKNTVVGSRAMNDLTTGSFNVAMGREAGLYPNEINNSTKTGSNNVFMGYRSGQSHNENTDESVAIGSYATTRTKGTAIGRKTKAGGVGSVAIGIDSQGNGATATNDNEFVLGTENHNVKVKGTLNLARYTPTSSADTRGQIGDITSDDNYIYTKTSTGWKRSALSTW